MYFPSYAFYRFCNIDILDHRKNKLLSDFDVLIWGELCLHKDNETVCADVIAQKYWANLRKVQKSLRRLSELDLIEKNKKSGQNWSYRLGIKYQKAHANFTETGRSTL